MEPLSPKVNSTMTQNYQVLYEEQLAKEKDHLATIHHLEEESHETGGADDPRL